MKIKKDVKHHGMPWEDDYGYAQAVKVGNTIFVSGQFSHDDEGNFIGAAPISEDGKILDHSNMEIQMLQTYKNAEKILRQFGADLDNVVEEVIYATNVAEAIAVAGQVRKEVYKSQKPVVSSTLLETPRLALPHQLIEIKITAKMK